MKSSLQQRLCVWITLIFVLLLTGCGGGQAPLFVVATEHLVVNPPIASINIDTTQQFTASFIDAEGVITDVTDQVAWSTTSSSVATVDQNGLALGMSTGTADIIATLDKLTASAQLEVFNKTITAITIMPAEAFTIVGLEKQFTAVAYFNDNSQQDVTDMAQWSSSNPSIASVSAGTALGLSAGETTLTALFSGQQASATLRVSSSPVVGFVIDPEQTSLPAGTKTRLSCLLLLDNGDSIYITEKANWVSENGQIAMASNTPGSKGEITAVFPGSVSILAFFDFNDQTITAEATVTVTTAALSSLEIFPNTLTLPRGATGNYSAIAFYTDNTHQDVTRESFWTSRDQSIISINSAGNEAGKALAVGTGQSTVTAEFRGLSAKATAVVGDAEIRNLLITPAMISVPTGTQGTYTAIAYYSDNTHQDVSREATWSSSNTNVIWIVTNGPGAGDANAVSPGTTIINASFGGLSAAADAEVTDATITELEIIPFAASIPKGNTYQYSATAYYTDFTHQDVTALATWTSGDSSIAGVSNQAGQAGLATGISVGGTTIYADFDGWKAVSTISVTEAEIRDLVITPNNVSMPAGTMERFRTEAFFSDGSVYDVTPYTTWSSSNPDIVQIVTTGSLTGTSLARNTGQAIIQGSFGGLTAEASAEVTAAVIEALQVTPGNLSVPVGTTGRYQATAYYSDLSHQDVTALATWNSSAPAIITIETSGTDAGTAQAIAVGPAAIRADFAGKNDSVDTTVTDPELDAIVISPPEETVPAGQSMQFIATGIYGDGSSQDLTQVVIWASDNAAVAGVYRDGADAGLALTYSTGIANISASYGGKDASAPLTVSTATLQDLQVTPVDAALAAGTKQQYTATAFFSDGQAEDVTTEATWQSSRPDFAVITSTGSDAGLAQALSEGTTDITASYNHMSVTEPLTRTVPLVVTAAEIKELYITPLDPFVGLGSTQSFTAHAVYSDGTSQDVSGSGTWQSDNTAVATIIASGTDAGTAQSLSQGTTGISFSYDGQTASTTLTVTPAGITEIQITPAAVTVYELTDTDFFAVAVYEDGTSKDVTRDAVWVSSNIDTAYITPSGDSAGRAIARNVDANETVTITAYFGGSNGTATMTVQADTVDSLRVEPINQTLPAGTTLQYKAFARMISGRDIEVTRFSDWQVIDTSVAVVDNTLLKAGLVTTLSAGDTQVQATWGGVIASTPLTVGAANLVSLQLEPADYKVPAGLTYRYKAIGIYSDGSTQDLTENTIWSSSAPAIMSIGSSGETRAWATALTVGTTTITADHNGVIGSTSATVTDPDLESIVITPPEKTVPAGISVQFTATGIYSDGSSQDLTQLVTWLSSDVAVAGVYSGGADAGLALTYSTGLANISASYEGKGASAPLTVTVPTLENLQVTPTDASVVAGFQQQYIATAFYSDGQVEDVSTEATWQSANETIAVITTIGDGAGLAQALTTGTTDITASYGGKSRTVPLVVTDAVIQGLNITPLNPSVALGTAMRFTAHAVYSNGTSQEVTESGTWVSNNTSVASIITTGTEAGTAQSQSEGFTDISCNYQGETASTTMTVTEKVLTEVQITPAAVTMIAYDIVDFTATAVFSDGTIQDVTLDAVWVSSDVNVAHINPSGDSAGRALARNAGTTTITANFGTIDGTPAFGTATMTVQADTLNELRIIPASESVPAGVPVQYQAFADYASGASIRVTKLADWQVIDTSVAVVDNTFLNGGLVTTLSAGNTQVQVTWGGAIVSTPLTVTDAELVSVQLQPIDIEVQVDSKYRYKAIGTFTDSSTHDLTENSIWSSSAPDIILIGSSGETKAWATALASGPATIRADNNGVIGSTSATVVTGPLPDLIYLKGVVNEYPTARLLTDFPTQDALPNYDPERDNALGLKINRGANGWGDTDPNKYQQFVAPDGDYDLDSPVSLTFWSAMKDFNNSKRGVVDAFLLDCFPTGFDCFLIAKGQKVAKPWDESGDWAEYSIDFGHVTYSVPTGRSLAVEIIVNGDSEDAMWFAYDTTSYPSVLEVLESIQPTKLVYLKGDVNEYPTARLFTDLPTQDVLPNYDPDRDSELGLLIKRGANGWGDTDPNKYQQFVAPDGDYDLDNSVSLTFWSVMKDFNTSHRGVVDAFLLDCLDTGLDCLLIAQGQKAAVPWNESGDWAEYSINFGHVTYSVPAGRSLTVEIIVNNDSEADMWFAYDTTSYPSVLTFSD